MVPCMHMHMHMCMCMYMLSVVTCACGPPAAGETRERLAAPLGTDQGYGQRSVLIYDLYRSYGCNQEIDMGGGDEFRFCDH